MSCCIDVLLDEVVSLQGATLFGTMGAVARGFEGILLFRKVNCDRVTRNYILGVGHFEV